MHRGNGSGLMLKVSAQDTPRSIASGVARKGEKGAALKGRLLSWLRGFPLATGGRLAS